MEYRLLNICTNKFNLINKIKNGVEYKLQPSFGKKISKLNDKTYDVYLSFSLHDSDSLIVPYDIDLEMKATFELNDINQNDLENFLNINAISILFPYLRTTLSSLMSSMMLPPIILPIIDARELFDKK